MKRFLTILCAIVISGAALSAQEADTTIVTSTDTLVVIVKHEAGENFFDVVGKPFKKGYKAVEKAFVDGYKATEDAFVEPLLTQSVPAGCTEDIIALISGLIGATRIYGVSLLHTDTVSETVYMSEVASVFQPR